MKYTRLGDLLVGNGSITQEQLQEALAMQKTNGKRLGTILKENHIITEKQVIEALMNQLGLEYVDLNSYSISSEMAQILPKGIAKQYMVVPIRATRTEVYLAMADPLNFTAIEAVRSATRRHVIPVIATEEATERAVLNLYSNHGAMKAIEDMRRDLDGQSYTTSTLASMENRSIIVDGEEDAAPTIRLVNSIIERACTERASDIHIEPVGAQLNIRMRIDGILRPIITVPHELQASVISRIKVMANLDIAQKQVPQDGRIKMNVRQEDLDLRISTLPTIYGEKIVIRILRQNNAQNTIEGIGLVGRNRQKLLDLMNRNTEGVILIVGPTGSGKTSTMYAMIEQMKSEEVNLISIEDPVEYQVDGVCQVQINEKTDLTFANTLRAVLRQDPDIIAVGEIRDGETAEIAMRAAMTGHMVISTIHTNDAVSSLDRLLDLGVEPYLIAGAIRGIVSQRLVRRICPHCKKEYVSTSEELQALGLSPESKQTFYKGEGCSECFHTGYRGRIGVFEILTMTPDIQKAIHSRSLSALEEAIERSEFAPIMENSTELISNGVTTVEEVLRVIGKR